jgi:hypothetical protein
MSSIAPAVTAYSVHRLTVDVPVPLEEFRQQYEQAAPAAPWEQVDALVARGAPWSEMAELIDKAAPWGFIIYWRLDLHPVMGLAGDTANGISYLMGNHILAERMYRHQPAVMLYAPLHTMIWQSPDGGTHFTFDRPGDQFGSFGNPQITEVGRELDQKLAALLGHLGLDVPSQLTADRD